MTNPRVTIAAFADELTYNAQEHAEFFGKRNMPISTRWFSFDDATRAETFWQLPYDEAKALSVKLKEEGKIKHVCTATDDELKQYKDILDANGARVWDIGSMLGKQYLEDMGSMAGVSGLVERIITASKILETDKARVFNFYPGKDASDLAAPGSERYFECFDKAASAFTQCARELGEHGILSLLEVEANLLGRNGDELARFYEEVNPHGELKLLMYFDGGNMVIQDHNREGLSLNTYISMAPYLGGMHIKDCTYKGGKVEWPFTVGLVETSQEGAVRVEPVDEEAKHPFVEVGEGNADYEIIFRDLRLRIPVIERMLQSMGMAPEVGVVKEPHGVYGGPLGGFTGPKFQRSADALCRMLNCAHIDHQELYNPNAPRPDGE